MLKRFSAEGYRNFAKVRMNLADVGEENGRYMRDGISEKTVVYGRSSSGKTNLGHAIFDIVGVLTNNCFPGPADESGSFYYEFAKDGDAIVYRYCRKGSRFVSESFEVNGETVFDFDYRTGKRDTSGIELINANAEKLNKFDGSMSVLRLLGHNTKQAEGSPVSYVMDFAERMLYLGDGERIGFDQIRKSPEQRIMDRRAVGELEDFLNRKLSLALRLETDVFLNKIVISTDGGCMVFRETPSQSVLTQYLCWRKSFDEASFLYIDDMFRELDPEVSSSLFDDVISCKAQTVIAVNSPAYCGKMGNRYCLALSDNTISANCCGEGCCSKPETVTIEVPEEPAKEEPASEKEPEPAVGEIPAAAEEPVSEVEEVPEKKPAEAGLGAYRKGGSKKVLYIVDNGRNEFELMENLWNRFDDETDYDVYVYRTKLSRLANIMFDGDRMKDADLIETLLSVEKSKESRYQLEQGPYDFVYLMYDFDPKMKESVMTQMIERFNDPSKAKLYVNYPTVESYRHISGKDDAEFKDRTVDILRIREYNRSVDSIGWKKIKHLPSCTKEIFRELVRMHMMKINYIVNGDYSMPDREWFMTEAPKDLLEMQYQWGRDYGSIFVVNTGLFNIVDAMPEEFFE